MQKGHWTTAENRSLDVLSVDGRRLKICHGCYVPFRKSLPMCFHPIHMERCRGWDHVTLQWQKKKPCSCCVPISFLSFGILYCGQAGISLQSELVLTSSQLSRVWGKKTNSKYQCFGCQFDQGIVSYAWNTLER
jgi:hypothetical protein